MQFIQVAQQPKLLRATGKQHGGTLEDVELPLHVPFMQWDAKRMICEHVPNNVLLYTFFLESDVVCVSMRADR